MKDMGYCQNLLNYQYDMFILEDGCTYTRCTLDDKEKVKRFQIKNEVLQPTLTELIEACKDRFNSLYINHERNNWTATCNNFAFTASTPEEAVAKLWIYMKAANNI